jgi:hypothetical protein
MDLLFLQLLEPFYCRCRQSWAGGQELKKGLSFGLLTRLKEDKTMISVSLSLQPRAAAAVLTPGVECVALKDLRTLRARILPSNRLLDALDLSRTIGDC